MEEGRRAVVEDGRLNAPFVVQPLLTGITGIHNIPSLPWSRTDCRHCIVQNTSRSTSQSRRLGMTRIRETKRGWFIPRERAMMV